MDWSQVITILAANIAIFFGIIAIMVTLFLWVRSEAREDHRTLLSWTQQMMNTIQQENKEFHGKLCAIEERNKKCD